MTVNDLGRAASETTVRIAESARKQNPENPIKVVNQAENTVRAGLILSSAVLIGLSTLLGIAATIITGVFCVLIAGFLSYTVSSAVNQVIEYIKGE